MKKIETELTKKEQDILEHRGFYVKNNITFYNMLASSFLFIIFHYGVGFLTWFISLFIFMMLSIMTGLEKSTNEFLSGKGLVIWSQIPLIMLMSIMFVTYIFQGKQFYGAKSPRLGFIGKIIKKCTNITKSILKIFGNNTIIMLPITVITSVLLIRFFINVLEVNYYNFKLDPDWYLRMVLNITLGFYVGGFILRQLVEIFHPLYSFGNIGEKIQKLTPQITSQSQLIESEFDKNMNFTVLHDGFDKLSSTFSQIISLVVRLEKAEKRANTGNLFDSEKYINSLRSDIITPLTTLKAFLEKQRDELIASQSELLKVRVRVGGEKGEGNLDLASKRSNSLLPELERNIGALDTMIGKIG